MNNPKLELISLKEPFGLVFKIDFPYSSHFWDDDPSLRGYYIGLTQDIGMDTVIITDTLNVVSEWFRGFDIKNIRYHLDSKYSNYKIINPHELNFENITNTLASPWYGDAVWISFTVNSTEVMIQPESDGTEIGLFFTGINAEVLYETILSKVQPI